MASPSVGEIYEYYVEYKENPSQGKSRPIVILKILNNGHIIAAAAITSKNNNSHFSHAKLPIINWRSKMTGLTSMSWAVTDDLLILEPRLLKRRLGQMHPLDFRRLAEVINFR